MQTELNDTLLPSNPQIETKKIYHPLRAWDIPPVVSAVLILTRGGCLPVSKLNEKGKCCPEEFAPINADVIESSSSPSEVDKQAELLHTEWQIIVPVSPQLCIQGW